MRFLLTGACGLLGRAIARRAERDHELVCMDVVDDVRNLPNGVCADVTDEKAVFAAVDGCDAIIHTAAMHGGFRGKATPAQFITTNVCGAGVLFEAALKFNVPRLVLSSTMEVLIGKSWDAYGTAVLHESLPPRPDWIYPLTKLHVEQMSEFYSRVHGLQTVNLRYMYIRDLPLEKIGFGLLARQFTDTDAADANLLAATAAGVKHEVLHIGPDTPLTQHDTNQAVAGQVWEVLERHWPGSEVILKRNHLQPDPAEFWPAAPVDRAMQVLGWKPESKFGTFLNGLGWSNV